MKRDLLAHLATWKNSALRAPLIIKGARQVGKSWVAREFGKQFDNYVELNFEKNKLIKSAFTGDINIPKITEQISIYTSKPIIPGKTLLFLDEIQECPEAIIYLRYFKEELPELHVVAAGSLIEFALEKVGMPVGRVEYLYLTPLSFGEFLEVSGRKDLRELSLNKENNPITSQLLQELLRSYLWLGGMPEVINTWLRFQDYEACRVIQDRIIASYQDDFPRYSKRHQVEYVEKVFKAVPLQFGKKFKYVNVDSDTRAILLKGSLALLEKAGIAHICYYTSGQKPPLAASINEKFFKAFFLDIGLAQRLLRLSYQEWVMNPIMIENLGELAEQFVAQELIAYRSQQTKEHLYYWQRESKNSSAEIDFVISANNHIVPIEVKAGKTSRLKSLQIYLDTHENAKYGIRISERPYERYNNILQIPLYGIENWLKSEII
jgi:predicted AAA+ superfamily ATPase